MRKLLKITNLQMKKINRIWNIWNIGKFQIKIMNSLNKQN